MSIAPDTSPLWMALLLALVGVVATLHLAGLLYWLLRADLNTAALFSATRKLLDANDLARLLKLLRVIPASPIATVLRHALTLDPASLRPKGSRPHTGGYRDEHPIDHAAVLRAHLYAVGYDHARTGHRLWRAGVVSGVVPLGVFVTLGPWTARYAHLPWMAATAALGLVAAHALARSRVLRKVEAAVSFSVPHVGALAPRRP